MELLLFFVLIICFWAWSLGVGNKVKDRLKQQDEIAANQQKILEQQEEILRRQRENETNSNDEP